MGADHRKIADDYAAGATLKQCASKYNCAVGSVRHAIKKYGIEPRSRNYRSKSMPDGTEKTFEAPHHKNSLCFRTKPVEYPARELILRQAAEACNRLGGLAQIDDRYMVIDTSLYQVQARQGDVQCP